MITGLCCCTSEENWATECPGTLPSPLAGCAAPKWRVWCYVYGMQGVQYGTGQVLDTSDGGCLDCFKGSCALTALHQGMVDFADPYAESECWTTDLLTEACAKFDAGKAIIPISNGHHVIEWVNEYSLSNITLDDQSDCVTILDVLRCRPFAGCAGSTQQGLFCEVIVEFRFSHTFNAWSLNPGASGDCEWTQYALTVTQVWSGIYQRRMQVGEYYAVGLYRLVRAVPPLAGWIYPGSDPRVCTTTTCPPVQLPNEYCAANYESGVNYQGVGFPWTPPSTINLIRLC